MKSVVVVAENLEYLLTYKVPTLERECAGQFNWHWYLLPSRPHKVNNMITLFIQFSSQSMQVHTVGEPIKLMPLDKNSIVKYLFHYPSYTVLGCFNCVFSILPADAIVTIINNTSGCSNRNHHTYDHWTNNGNHNGDNPGYHSGNVPILCRLGWAFGALLISTIPSRVHLCKKRKRETVTTAKPLLLSFSSSSLWVSNLQAQ